MKFFFFAVTLPQRLDEAGNDDDQKKMRNKVVENYV